MAFYRVLPSRSSNDIFFGKSCGKVYCHLTKRNSSDEERHWEVALVELFCPKHDSVSVSEKLWYETQESKRKWKRTYVPTSLFYSAANFLDYVKKRFEGKILH